MGDQLIRIPQPGPENRSEPYAYKEGLRLLIRQHPNMNGVEKAGLALDEMRVGADSFPETFLRLALLAVRCPNWSCGSARSAMMTARPRPTWVPEVSARRSYDGAHHLTREQQSRDNRRDEAFRGAGWAYSRSMPTTLPRASKV